HESGVNVFNFFLGESRNITNSLDGLYIDGNIALSNQLENDAERSCVLSEELGHHFTTSGNILDQGNAENSKQELKARTWAYDNLVGLQGIIDAYLHGCRNIFEMSDYLEVTEQFLMDTIKRYKSKYGLYKKIGKHMIIFDPLCVLASYE
ncbi:MAG: ImmA/IrrE family metallo-endopeptidase, partial [Agathobacter sp.]